MTDLCIRNATGELERERVPGGEAKESPMDEDEIEQLDGRAGQEPCRVFPQGKARHNVRRRGD